jgi:hypothetical protein
VIERWLSDAELRIGGRSGREFSYWFERRTTRRTGFDGVPGRSTDGTCRDSGVETGYTPTDGQWTAYLMSGDPSVWQVTDRVMEARDIFQLAADARITWAATDLQIALLYQDGDKADP